MDKVIIYQQKSIISDLYNKVWRWQYLKRRAISRYFSSKAMRLSRKSTPLSKGM